MHRIRGNCPESFSETGRLPIIRSDRVGRRPFAAHPNHLNLWNRGRASRSLRSIAGLQSDGKRLEDITGAGASDIPTLGLTTR